MAEALQKADRHHLRGRLAGSEQPWKDAPQRHWRWNSFFAL